jgi:hypothetical protein
MEITCVTVDCADPAAIAWEETFTSEIAGVYRNVVLRDVEGNEFCLSGGALPS